MIFGWTNKDSENLASIAKSLKKILGEETYDEPKAENFLSKLLRNEGEVKEIEVSSPDLESAFEVEQDKAADNIFQTVKEAQRTNTSSFFFEDNLDAEQLESINADS